MSLDAAAPPPPDTRLALMDEVSRRWLERLGSQGSDRAEALQALFELLHRGARHEAFRRRGSLPPRVMDELEDLARQAADDALTTILRKLPEYRGLSRFTTWAYKFVIFEISNLLRREAWRDRTITIDEASWGRLQDMTTVDPAAASDARELVAAIERSVTTDLSAWQREVFMAVVVLEVPIHVVADRHNRAPGAVYKVLHDARRKLRTSLRAQGWYPDEAGGVA